MPTTQAQWLKTADHNIDWYMKHKNERRALLKSCDTHKETATPDCSNANSAAIGVGDY
jgi:chlorite dismutase